MAIDPTTGKPYDFSGSGWRFDRTPMQGNGVDASPGEYRAGISSELLNQLPGYSDWLRASPYERLGLGGGNNAEDQTQNFLSQSGLRVASRGAPGGGQYSQAFDASGNPVGQPIYVPNQDGDGAFGLAVGLMGLYGGAAAAGMLGGAGAGAGAVDGAGGMALQEGAMPGGALSGGGVAAGAPSVAGAAPAVAAPAAGGSGGLLGSGGGILGSGVSLGQAGSLLGAAAGALGNGSGLNSATQSVQNKIDPRIAQYLFGADGASGLLGSASGLYQQQMADPTYMQGFQQMRNVGSGLLSQPIAGNPFTSGQMQLGARSPQSLMQAGGAYIPGRMSIQPITTGLLGNK